MEDVLFGEQAGKSWTYNIARPPAIIGWTVRTAMNLGVSLAVYATVLKELGQPLIFPYSQQAYHALREFVDSSLLCDFVLWLAPDDIRKGTVNRKLVPNETFNIHNGDYYRMEQLWPKLAQYFGMEARLAEKPTTFYDIMKGKEELWDKTVKKYSLKQFKLHDLLTLDFMHAFFCREFDELTLIQKAVRAGFTEQTNSESMFVNFFDGLKLRGIIPDGAQVSSE